MIPNTHQENDINDLRNKILNEYVKIMKSNAILPIMLWALVNIVIYLINKEPLVPQYHPLGNVLDHREMKHILL